MRHRLAAFLCAFGVAGPLAAQDVGFDVDRAATLLDRAAIALATAGSADNELIALGRAVRAYETGLAAQRRALRRLAVESARLEEQLATDQDRAAKLLGALQMVEQTPPGLMLLHPDGPLAAAQAAHVMGTLSPKIQAQVRRIAAGQAELDALTARREEALWQFETAADEIRDARARLDAMMRRRGTEPDIGALALVAKLRADAASMQSLAGALRREPLGEVPDGRAFADRRGELIAPVAGAVLRRFDTADAGGFVRPGLVIATEPVALVTAPASGTLRFAGPFLDYGTIAILEPQEDYLLILAGLSDVSGTVGDVIAEGAPLGYVTEAVSGSEDFLIESDRDPRPNRPQSLYIELRYAGEPIDPEPWFVFDRSGDRTE